MLIKNMAPKAPSKKFIIEYNGSKFEFREPKMGVRLQILGALKADKHGEVSVENAMIGQLEALRLCVFDAATGAPAFEGMDRSAAHAWMLDESSEGFLSLHGSKAFSLAVSGSIPKEFEEEKKD